MFKAMALVLLLASLPRTMSAWGCDGHRSVAFVAWKLLAHNANARQHITDILAKLSTPRTGCKQLDDVPAIVNASTWADAVRSDTTAPWHFIDVPIASDVAPDAESHFCSKGCVTQKIRTFRDQLAASPDDVSPKQANALAFLIHFAGDIHQPLHTETNNDRGGNCVPVVFRDKEPHEQISHKNGGTTHTGKYTPELHGVWDTDLVQEAMSEHTLNQFAVDLAKLARQHQAEWNTTDPIGWAAEAHRLARETGYGKLAFQPQPGTPSLIDLMHNPSEPEACVAVDEKEAFIAETLQVTINDDYADDAVDVITPQLAKAGLRLARMLATIWPTQH